MMTDAALANARVTVTNTLGQLVATSVVVKGQSTASLTLSAAAGVYTVRVLANGQVVTRNVYVENR